MAIFFYGIGFLIGNTYIHKASEDDFDFFKKSFIEPHKEYRFLRKNRRKNDMAYSSEELIMYLKVTMNNAYYFFYYNLYDKYRIFNHYKQQNNFDLIRDFEFMHETLQNLDVIQSNLNKRISQENFIIEEKIKSEENYEKELNRSDDDKNMENILLMKNNSADEFYKYQLSNNIYDKDEYEKSILPEIKLDRENTKIMLAKGIADARKEFTDNRRRNLYDNFVDRKKTVSFLDNQKKDYMDKMRKQDEREIENYSVSKKVHDEGIDVRILENVFSNKSSLGK